MNERDSEAAAAMFSKRGHEIVDHESQADVLIFNTCSVRDQAERKAVGKIGFMKKLKKERPELIIGVMGCMAQNRGEDLFKELPHLDFVLGTGQLHRLPDIVDSIHADQRAQVALLDPGSEVLTGLGEHYNNSIFASIAITRGCNRYCSYCIVPYVRGREISRSIEDIAAETRELVADGTREILLLGQNVAAFGLGGDINPPPPDHSPFADLLEELCKIDGLKRLRFTSPYPSYFNDKLIRTITAQPKICRSIHLPLQSGSDRILKAMNRHYTAAQYLEIIDKIRAAAPDVAFSTDIIVGFPGETDEDFAATRELMNRVGYDMAYIFRYSPRQGTVAAKLSDDISQEIKEERNQILLKDLEERTAAANRKLIGSVQEVLVEGVSKRNTERWSGKSTTAKTVIFEPAPDTAVGDLVKVRINRVSAVSLFGELVR
jgi:tRNA-2-methylthio-N6-dimethylallyladenosine synthase